MQTKYLLTVFMLFAAFLAKAQNPTDSVLTIKCGADSNQSYCIYLPPTYREARLFPAIFLFDPAARGRLAANEFKAAAKALGFMVFASNNSRNGPMVSSLQAANSMFEDAFKRFRIDDQQVYLGGFSGGARVATTIALQNSHIAGVLACGAGFAEEIPAAVLPWNFVGIAGNQDFNYIELQQLRQQLDRLHSTNNLITFKGIHSWPPQSCVLEGLLWLHLEYRKKSINADDADLKKYEALMEAKIAASPGLAEKAGMYIQLADVSNNKPVYAQKVKQLLAIRSYQEQLIAQQQSISNEINYQKKLGEAFYLVDRMDNDIKPKSWWKAELASLNKMLLSHNINDSNYVARQKAFINANASISFDNYFRAKHNDSAAEFLKICEVFDAANAMTAFRQAQLAASQGNENEAINDLELALKSGFTNKGMMRAEPAFQLMKTNKRYQALVRN